MIFTALFPKSAAIPWNTVAIDLNADPVMDILQQKKALEKIIHCIRQAQIFTRSSYFIISIVINYSLVSLKSYFGINNWLQFTGK